MKAQFVLIENIFADVVVKRFKKEAIDTSFKIISPTASVLVAATTLSSRSMNTNQKTETFSVNAYKIFVGKSEEKWPLGRTSCKREQIVVVKYVWNWDKNCIWPPQVRIQWDTVCKAALNFRVPKRMVNVVTAEQLSGS